MTKSVVTKKYRIRFNDGSVKDYAVEAKLSDGVFESFGRVADIENNKIVHPQSRRTILEHVDAVLFPGAHPNADYSVEDLNPEVVVKLPEMTVEEAMKIIAGTV